MVWQTIAVQVPERHFLSGHARAAIDARIHNQIAEENAQRNADGEVHAGALSDGRVRRYVLGDGTIPVDLWREAVTRIEGHAQAGVGGRGLAVTRQIAGWVGSHTVRQAVAVQVGQ